MVWRNCPHRFFVVWLIDWLVNRSVDWLIDLSTEMSPWFTTLTWALIAWFAGTSPGRKWSSRVWRRRTREATWSPIWRKPPRNRDPFLQVEICLRRLLCLVSVLFNLWMCHVVVFTPLVKKQRMKMIWWELFECSTSRPVSSFLLFLHSS